MLKPEQIRKMKIEDIDKMIKDIEYQQMIASSKWSNNMVKKNKAGIKGVSTKGEQTSILKDLRRTKARLLTIKQEIENGK
jgi:ribosomal protein L29